MAHSSLLGVNRTLATSPGHDTASLGPSDSSDTGSDVAGLEHVDDGDPGVPVDVSTAMDRDHPEIASEVVGSGVDSDTAGTGVRRSAGGDGGWREAPDITPDRIVSVSGISAPTDEFEAPLLDEAEAQDFLVDEVANAPDSEVEDDEEAQAMPDSSASLESRARPRRRARRP